MDWGEWKYTVYCDDFPSQDFNGAAVETIESAYMVWAILVIDGHDASLVRENATKYRTLAWSDAPRRA